MSILSARPIYNISVWEEIRTSVRPKLDALVQGVRIEISRDSSLAEFQGKDPVPWQLAQIMGQRGEAWLQRLYDICRDAYKNKGKIPTGEFDRAVWAFCIEPFIMDGDPKRILSYTDSGLLQLLLCAVGSPPEERNLLKVSQKNCCLTIRARLWETWRDRLTLTPPGSDEPVAGLARTDPTEVSMTRTVGGVFPTPVLANPSDWESSPSYCVLLKQPDKQNVASPLNPIFMLGGAPEAHEVLSKTPRFEILLHPKTLPRGVSDQG